MAIPILLGVKVIEPGLDLDCWIVPEMTGLEDVFEIIDPLEIRHGASPGDHDMSPSEPSDPLLISRNGYIAHPIRVRAPHLVQP